MKLFNTLRNHVKARNAWKKGFPEAKSIEHAASEWAPYVDAWTHWAQQGKYFSAWTRWRSYSTTQPHYGLAWITHEPFWKALCQYSTQHLFTWWPEITQEAANQGNVVALQNIHKNHCRAYFRRVDAGHQSTHPRSAQWAESVGFLKPNSPHLSHWTLDSSLNTSPWQHGLKAATPSQQGLYSMSQWCISAIECNALSQEQAMHAVGHCMELAQYHGWINTSMAWQWFEEAVRPAYRKKIDWDLLAALHGVGLPTEHSLHRWSDVLVAIAESPKHSAALNTNSITALRPDPVLQFLLDSANPLNVKNIYRAIYNAYSFNPVDTFALPIDAF